MSNKATSVSDTSDRELVYTRVFNAPRELVYQAWTDPRHVVNWWGPNGFTNTIHSMDVKPGGVWRFIMHGPDGHDYPNKIVFLEVEPSRKLVYHHCDDVPEGGNVSFHVTVTFEDQAGQTKLTMKMVFSTREERDQVIKEYGADQGANETLERLRKYLPELTVSAQEILSARVFDAPREKVFQAFSDPRQLQTWWGPSGFTNTFEVFDFRPGGSWKFIMHGPDGTPYHNEVQFTEIVHPERIVFNHGKPMHHFTMTMSFEDLGKKTRLCWRMRFDSDEECAKVKSFIIDANEQNFDRLATALQGKHP